MVCGAQLSMSISSVAGASGPNEVYLYGSKGTLRFRDGKLWGSQRDAPALKEISIPTEEQNGWRVEEEFINAIRGIEKVSLTTFKDGFKYMAFTDAVMQSMFERKTMQV